MKISKEEQKAIRTAVSLGKKFGYGNLLGHLASAWAAELIAEHGMDEGDALTFTGSRRGYPVDLHRDLLERGEWDETGKRYRKKRHNIKLVAVLLACLVLGGCGQPTPPVMNGTVVKLWHEPEHEYHDHVTIDMGPDGPVFTVPSTSWRKAKWLAVIEDHTGRQQQFECHKDRWKDLKAGQHVGRVSDLRLPLAESEQEALGSH